MRGFVVRLGLEPRLFWTKTRRVASYTIGQFPTQNLLYSLAEATAQENNFRLGVQM